MQKGFMMKKDTIRFFRACCGYTQKEVAEAVDISVKRYASLENGETEPTDAELAAFARLYGVSLTTFTQEDYLNDTFSITHLRNLPFLSIIPIRGGRVKKNAGKPRPGEFFEAEDRVERFCKKCV